MFCRLDLLQGENILSVTGLDNYNLLQRAIGLNCLELVRWILGRGCDVNRGVCSLPLHIAALQGNEEIVELLLKHGARVDSEARMCFPGPHNQVGMLSCSSACLSKKVLPGPWIVHSRSLEDRNKASKNACKGLSIIHHRYSN